MLDCWVKDAEKGEIVQDRTKLLPLLYKIGEIYKFRIRNDFTHSCPPYYEVVDFNGIVTRLYNCGKHTFKVNERADCKIADIGGNGYLVVEIAENSLKRVGNLNIQNSRMDTEVPDDLYLADLTGIYIPAISTLETHSLLRSRIAIVKNLSRMKQRIKSLLMFYDILYPSAFEKSGTHWSKRFMKWLSEEITFSIVQGREALSLLVSSGVGQRKLLLEATRKIRELSRVDYEESLRLIGTVLGVGFIMGMIFFTEIEDIC